MNELHKLTQQLRDARSEVERQRTITLHAVGVQLLGFVREAYVAKSRGGAGSDGIQWAKLSRATIEQRVRSRAPAKRIVEERKRLAAEIRQQRGPGSPARIERLRARRKSLSERLQAMVDAEYANHAIGINTGLQLNSSQPGFIPADGKGGGLFKVSNDSVTIGFARAYSKHFDKKRPLLPEQLPRDWERRCDQIVEQHFSLAMRSLGK